MGLLSPTVIPSPAPSGGLLTRSPVPVPQVQQPQTAAQDLDRSISTASPAALKKTSDALNQETTAKHGVLGDIFNAPDNSMLGVIKNTVLGIPKAARDLLPQIAHGITRDVGGATVSLMGKDTVPIDPNDKVSKFIFGSEPIPSLYKNGVDTMVQNGTPPWIAKIEGLPFGMMLAISDVYAGPEEDAIKAISTLRKSDSIERLITTHYPALTEQAPALSKVLADVKDPTQVSQIIKDALHKTTADAIANHPEAADITYEPTHEEGQTQSLEQAAQQHQSLATPEIPQEEPARFNSVDDILREADRPKEGKQGLDLTKPEMEQVNTLLSKVTNPENVEARGTIYKPYGYKATGSADIILGKIGRNTVVAEMSKDGTITNHIRVHASNISPSDVIGKYKEPEIAQLTSSSPAPVPSVEPVKSPTAPANTNPIPSEYHSLAEEAVKHPDAQSFLNAVANHSDESLIRDLYTLKKNPIDGVTKTPTQFYERAVQEHASRPAPAPDPVAEARDRSLKELDTIEAQQKDREVGVKGFHATPGTKMRDLGEGTWESMVKGYSKNLPGAQKFAFQDYLGTPEFVLEKIGLQKGAELLQDAKDTYRTTLKTEIQKIEDWKKEVKGTPDSARRIFKYLDGDALHTKTEMTPKEYQVAQEIKSYLKQWAVRLGLPEDHQVSNYITHLFENTTEKPGETVFDDPELANIMRDNVAKSVYDPFLQRRVNKPNYKEDVWAALDAYVKRGSRKEAMDPALEALSKMAAKLDDASYKFVADLTHRINMRPTDLDKAIDNMILQSPIGGKLTQRPTAYITQKIREPFYRGFLGFNVSSALRNLSQGANTYAKLGEKHTIIGYTKLFKNLMSGNLGDLYEHGVLDESLIQDKKVGVYKSALQKLDPALFFMFEQAEKVNRGAAYYGAVSKYLAENTRMVKGQQIFKPGASMDEATKFAKRLVRETQFSFGTVDTPIGISGDLVKTALQLQNYNVKQVEFLSRMVAQKDFGGLLRYTGASLLFLYTIGKTFGMTIDQLLPTLSFGSPAVSTVTNIATLLNPGANAADRKKALTGIKNDAVAFIPGGTQIKKTLTGVDDVNKGEVTDTNGVPTANVEKTPENYIKGALFGPSGFTSQQSSKDKINTLYNIIGKQNNGSSTKKAIDTYDKLKQVSQTKGADEANAQFEELKKSDPALAKLVLTQAKNDKLGLTKEQLLIKQLGVADGTRAKYLADQFNGMTDQSAKKALWEEYVRDKIITPQVSGQLMPLLKK